MTIVEATRLALKVDGCITTPMTIGKAKIKPTNTDARCIVSGWNGENPSKHGWQPSAEDLRADDWIVVDGDGNTVKPEQEDIDVEERLKMLNKRVYDYTTRMEHVWEAFKHAAFYLCAIYAVCIIVVAAYWFRQFFT